jgi:hypothetical protein
MTTKYRSSLSINHLNLALEPYLLIGLTHRSRICGYIKHGLSRFIELPFNGLGPGQLLSLAIGDPLSL